MTAQLGIQRLAYQEVLEKKVMAKQGSEGRTGMGRVGYWQVAVHHTRVLLGRYR